MMPGVGCCFVSFLQNLMHHFIVGKNTQNVKYNSGSKSWKVLTQHVVCKNVELPQCRVSSARFFALQTDQLGRGKKKKKETE